MINLTYQMKLKSRYKYFNYIYLLYVCNTVILLGQYNLLKRKFDPLNYLLVSSLESKGHCRTVELRYLYIFAI